jgi:hypothetical protein
MTGMSRTAFLTMAYIFFVMMSATASAADPLGLYLGASVGISHVRTEDDKVNCCDVWRFDDSHTGRKVYGGVRPLSFVAVEAAYTDFGHTSAPPPLSDTSTRTQDRARQVYLGLVTYRFRSPIWMGTERWELHD